jgi:hypothetical protein
MYLLDQDSATVRIGNCAAERWRLWHVAEMAGASLVVHSQRCAWWPLRVRSFSWLEGYGEVVARLQGTDHLNVELRGEAGVVATAVEYLEALEDLTARREALFAVEAGSTA